MRHMYTQDQLIFIILGFLHDRDHVNLFALLETVFFPLVMYSL